MEQTRFRSILVATLLTAALVFSMSGCGAAPQRTFRVGIVSPSAAYEPIIQSFKDGLAEYGYIEGEDVIYIYDGPLPTNKILHQLQQFGTDKVDLVLTLSTSTALAAKQILANGSIPVIFAPINNPLHAGLISTMREPGGFMTGIKAGGYVEKELDWLLRVKPSIRQIYVPYNPYDVGVAEDFQHLKDTAAKLGIILVETKVTNSGELSSALAQMSGDVDAILLLEDTTSLEGIEQISKFAIERKIPLASINKDNSKAGALLSYGPDFSDVGRQCARLADQIFKGIPPGTLPVESAELHLNINLQTAKAIGITIPDDLLKAAETILR